ncbi:TPA: peptide ABC transporter substrate-binding protein, partial [Klebsiella pneumoniae]
ESLRTQIYGEMQQLCSDEGGALIPMFANSVAARSTRIAHGPRTAPFGELDGLRAIERWWQA